MDLKFGSGKSKKEMKEMAIGMGRQYGMGVMEMDKDAKDLVGAGFFKDFGKGFVDGLKMVAKVAKPVLSLVPHPAAQAASKALGAVGLGKGKKLLGRTQMKEEDLEGGRKHRAKAGAGDKRKRRGQLISKLMKEKGMSLGEASKHIKQHNLI
jgi:hypothetical protein